MNGVDILDAADKNRCRKRTLTRSEMTIPRKLNVEKPLVNQLHLVKPEKKKKETQRKKKETQRKKKETQRKKKETQIKKKETQRKKK